MPSCAEVKRNHRLAMAHLRRCQPTPRCIQEEKKHMKNSQELEAELLGEVKRARITYLGASDRCRERHDSSFRECLEAAARNYGNALRAFSSLILSGKIRERRGKLA